MASVAIATPRSRRASISLSWVLTTSIPVALFTLFAIGHVSNWHRTGQFTGAMLVAQELVFVALFVVRRRPTESSRQPLHWFVAMAGSFTILLLRPAAAPSQVVGDVGLLLQVLGACTAVICLTGLGRSFGIVAANRGLKVGGPYRIVRHPIYAAYLIGWAGYALASPTLRNMVVLGVSILFQLLRIRSEEGLLGHDEAYRAYADRVPYRLIPGIY
jgi:protein-S-isoprenylcysteine O-methyltransferase Ste14